MADKGRSCQFRQWLTAVIAAVSLSTVITPVDAQQRGRVSDPSRPSQIETPSRTGAPEANTETSPDKQGDSDTATETPEPTADSTTTAAETTEGNTIAPRRTKPERSHYFTAHYAQRFDDNVLLTPGRRSSDLVSVPQVGFGVTRVRRRSLIQIDYQGGAEIYKKYSELNGMLHSLDLRLEYDLSKRTTLFATDRFLTRPQTSGFGLFGTGTGSGALQVLSASRSTINDLTFGLTRRMSKFSDLRAIYSYGISRFNDSRLVDTNEQEIEIGYSLSASRTREYDLAYRVSKLTGIEDLTTHTLLPSLRYRRDRLSLRGGAGPQLAVAPTGNQLSVTALAEFSYTTRDTSYNVTYTTGIGTGGGLATASRNQTVFGSIERTINRKLQTEFRVGYSRSNNIGEATSPLLPAGFSSSSLIFESRTAYPIGNKLALFLDYSNSRQMGSGGSVGNLNRNIFSVGINFDTRRTERTTMLRPARF